MPQFKQFPMPDTAEGLTEAEILTWHVKPGDTVTVNQIIVEIETAKAAVELPCPWAGVVTELLAEVGQTVEVGVPIITIDIDPAGAAPAAPAPTPAAAPASNGKIGEEMPGGRIATLVGYGPRAGAAKRRPRKDAAGSRRRRSEPCRTCACSRSGARLRWSAEPVAAPAGGYVPLAKPPVRKLAKDLGVDLHALSRLRPGRRDHAGGRRAGRRARRPRAPAVSAATAGRGSGACRSRASARRPRRRWWRARSPRRTSRSS